MKLSKLLCKPVIGSFSVCWFSLNHMNSVAFKELCPEVKSLRTSLRIYFPIAVTFFLHLIESKCAEFRIGELVSHLFWNSIDNFCSSSFWHQTSHWQITEHFFFPTTCVTWDVHQFVKHLSTSGVRPSPHLQVRARMENHCSQLFLKKSRGEGWYGKMRKSILWSKCWFGNSLCWTRRITSHCLGEVLPGTCCVLTLSSCHSLSPVPIFYL